MQHRPAIAALAVAMVVLSACGGDDAVETGPATTSTPDAGPDTPVTSPPDGVIAPDAPELVEPDPSAIDVRPLSFDPAEAQPEDTSVLIPFWGGVAPCFVLADHDVVETAETVTVTLLAGRAPGSDEVACIELAVRYAVSVPLDAPLADRTLLDGSA